MSIKAPSRLCEAHLPCSSAWIPFVIIVALASGAKQVSAAETSDVRRPNVLFIALDDLNDWIGCLGGHPQTRTPHLDRFAANSMLFTNAHCAAPACNPSRTAVFTGIAPNRSGLYDNRQQMRQLLPTEPLLPAHFRRHGYWAAGSGKLLHYFIDAPSWDDYFPNAASENPFPPTFYPKQRPVSLPRGGPWQYVETDWGALDVSDETFGGDWAVTRWIGDQLRQKHEKPMFLACGIYRPHEPWYVPKKYFAPFPLESIQLPPGYKENDLNDIPPLGVRVARNRYFAHIQEHNQWKQGIQSYLAAIHFADAMVGRVLEALESGPNADTTIVVLWSDHGWQLGEKEHWQKFSPWRAVTRVPLIIRIPPGLTNRLPEGTKPARCDAPVNLLSLFPTLTELCNIPAKESCDGPSLVPLLKDPAAEWPHASVTYLSQPGRYAISHRTHRYIRYEDGAEELYDIVKDPFEWTNLSAAAQSQSLLKVFRDSAPQEFAKRIDPQPAKLAVLAWKPEAAPASRPVGSSFPVHFVNQRRQAVELFWMDRNGTPQSYRRIGAGKEKRQPSRNGAAWMIADPITNEPLGHFVVEGGKAGARATIPRTKP